VDRRPSTQPIARGASAEQTAAIVAAVEAVLRARPAPAASGVAGAPAQPSPWLRAGLLEGVSRADGLRAAWDDSDR
jgi:hypothetical protein